VAAALPARDARRGEDPGDEAARPTAAAAPTGAPRDSAPPPRTRREILIPEKHYDPFTNPNTETLLDFLDPHEILLFGVATEICDDAAVRALLRRGRRITFVEDAAKGVDESRAAACIETWRGLGVSTTTAEEAAAMLG
jgi:nicotinamidase-related amidase